jgi:secondary thiamine-phosphate synthase enzyme
VAMVVPGDLQAFPSFEGLSCCCTTVLHLQTDRGPQLIDITDQVEAAVRASGVVEGAVLIFSRHTTAAIKINEYEPLLLEDIETFLQRLCPRDGAFNHNDFTRRTVNMEEDECPNAHAHCLHLLLNTSETVPVSQGQILLGRWQRIFLVELDSARPRQVVVQVSGQRALPREQEREKHNGHYTAHSLVS